MFYADRIECLVYEVYKFKMRYAEFVGLFAYVDVVPAFDGLIRYNRIAMSYLPYFT